MYATIVSLSALYDLYGSLRGEHWLTGSDEFMMCYSMCQVPIVMCLGNANVLALVPQLRSLYRYGEFPDCQWKWQDFKYCLSMKSEPTEKRRELWIKRRAEWWANRRMTGSSEDVWDLRS